jgi:hypothetical protein
MDIGMLIGSGECANGDFGAVCRLEFKLGKE